MKKAAALGALLFTLSVHAETVVLQQGYNDYCGVEDAHIIVGGAEDFVTDFTPEADVIHIHRC